MRWGPLARTLPDLVAERAQIDPAAEAVVTRRRRVSYGQLHTDAGRAASRLAALGVARGSTVALLSPNSAEWVTAAVATTSLGARIAAFNTWVKAYELGYMLEHSEATVLIIAARAGRHDLLTPLHDVLPELWQQAPGDWRSARFPRLQALVVIGGEEVPPGAHTWEEVLAATEASEPAVGLRRSAGDTAFVLYTSGSTARPKAVPLLHYAAIENGFNIGERMGLDASDRVWLGSPLFWSFGAANALLATFTHGAALVVQEEYSPQAAAELIGRERCTAAYLLPTITHGLAGLSAHDRAKLATVRTGVTIGRPDEVRMAVEMLGITDICNVYGSTETYGNCCVTPHDMPLERRLTCQGPPLPGVSLRLRDPVTEEEVQQGHEGQIEVRGYLTPGYLGDDAVSADAFTSDGWYRTGDIGRILDDGSVQFVTRATDMIKTAGINVSPAEVEDCIRHQPGVAEVAVVGAYDAVRGEVVIAYVRAVDGVNVTPEAVIERCRREAASYKVPARVVLVEEMPKTSTGKLARRELRAMAEADLADWAAVRA